jgi:hypothetical protein
MSATVILSAAGEQSLNEGLTRASGACLLVFLVGDVMPIEKSAWHQPPEAHHLRTCRFARIRPIH